MTDSADQYLRALVARLRIAGKLHRDIDPATDTAAIIAAAADELEKRIGWVCRETYDLTLQAVAVETRRANAAAQSEDLSPSDKETALEQACEFAAYVERQAKGAMVDAARRFLSLPYAQQLAARRAALEAFHAFFRDRGEALFFQFGMSAVELYNDVERAGRPDQQQQQEIA